MATFKKSNIKIAILKIRQVSFKNGPLTNFRNELSKKKKCRGEALSISTLMGKLSEDRRRPHKLSIHATEMSDENFFRLNQLMKRKT